MRFCAKCVVCFDQRPTRRNPESASAAAQAVKSPHTVGHGSRGNFSSEAVFYGLTTAVIFCAPPWYCVVKVPRMLFEKD